MSTATLPETPQSLNLPLKGLYRLSVEQYHQIADAGILTTDDRVELIEGMLVNRVTISPLHTFVTQKFAELMNDMLTGWYARTQQPLTLADSEPEPDGAVVRGRAEGYRSLHPSIPNIGIVCEVADRSLAFDRGRKKRMYANNGVPEYWVANLKEKVVEVYNRPQGSEYRPSRIFSLSDKIPVELDGQTVGEISVRELFGE